MPQGRRTRVPLNRRLGKTVEARKKLLYTGGLTIHTTISLRDQRAADQDNRKGRERDDLQDSELHEAIVSRSPT